MLEKNQNKKRLRNEQRYKECQDVISHIGYGGKFLTLYM